MIKDCGKAIKNILSSIFHSGTSLRSLPTNALVVKPEISLQDAFIE